MLRLVLDTNVVLDLFHFADPTASPILVAIEAGRACCFADAAGLVELTRVVAYPEFRMSAADGAALMERYRGIAGLIEPGDVPKLPQCRDRDDQKFLELAMRSQADLLVSKDEALLKLKGRTNLPFRIVTPAAAVVLLTQ
ncbi:MAG: putative toxin-antitoxin system toxin component, PIN family [Actinomycetota bacterium]